MEGLKLLLDTRNKALSQMEKQFDQERETSKVKLSALNTQLAKK